MDTLPLDPATYWRLRFRQADSETAAARLEVARLRLELEASAAGVPPSGSYRWDDATCALVPVTT